MLKPKRRLTRREIKEDKFVTVVAEATDFFNQYKQYILFGLIGIVVVVAVSYFMIKSKQEANLFVSGKLLRAVEYHNNNDYQSAIPIFQSIVDEYAGTDNAGIATYYLANAYYLSENYTEAKRYFEAYQNEYGDDRMFLSSSYAGIAACFSVEGNKEAAAQNYQKAFDRYPESFAAPNYLFSAAQNYVEINQISQARSLLQRIIDDYETQSIANEAKLLLSEISKDS